MRWSRMLITLALMMLVVACGSPATTDAGDGNGSEQTEAPDPTSGDGGSGDGGGSAGSGDVDRVFEILTPPNSSELTKTTADGIIFAAFTSSDSFESLRSFYEDAISEAGLQIFSTTEAQGGIAWAIAESEGSSFGGTVSIFPASDGSDSNQISVTIGSSE